MTYRETYFGVEIPDHDPKPLTLTAYLTAELLLGCYGRAEVERLDRLASMNAVSDDRNEQWKTENNAIYVRACRLMVRIP